MMLCRYREALEDCQQAVRLDNSFMKASHGKRSILSRGKSSCSVLQFYSIGPFDNIVQKADGTQET